MPLLLGRLGAQGRPLAAYTMPSVTGRPAANSTLRSCCALNSASGKQLGKSTREGWASISPTARSSSNST